MINSGIYIYIYIYVKHSYMCHSNMRYCVVHSLNLVCTVYVYIYCVLFLPVDLLSKLSVYLTSTLYMLCIYLVNSIKMCMFY